LQRRAREKATQKSYVLNAGATLAATTHAARSAAGAKARVLFLLAQPTICFAAKVPITFGHVEHLKNVDARIRPAYRVTLWLGTR
jgi:hypothetical protein